jgi:putative endonuclease
MKDQPWFVYIIENEKGYLYTGITTDPARRFEEHASSKKGAKFFNTSAPVSIVFKKKFENRSLASKFECFVKKLSRSQKLHLIRTKKVPDVKRNVRADF